MESGWSQARNLGVGRISSSIASNSGLQRSAYSAERRSPEEWAIVAGGGSGYHEPVLITEENALAQGAGRRWCSLVSSASGLHFVRPRPLVTLSLPTACGCEPMAQ